MENIIYKKLIKEIDKFMKNNNNKENESETIHGTVIFSSNKERLI